VSGGFQKATHLIRTESLKLLAGDPRLVDRVKRVSCQQIQSNRVFQDRFE